MSTSWKHAPYDEQVDPYLDWSHGPGDKFPPGFDDYLVTFNLVPRKGASADDLRTLFEPFGIEAALDDRQSATPFECVFPENNFVKSPSRAVCEVLTAQMPAENWRAFLDAYIADADFRSALGKIIPGRPLPADAVCVSAAPARAKASSKANANRRKAPKAKKNTVIIAIIDEGTAIANSRFRNASTDTRVRYAWVQDGKCVEPVEGFSYGREWAKPAIDALLADCLSAGQVNEKLFYQRMGLDDFSRPRQASVSQYRTHGTHVLDIAAGFNMGEPAACSGENPEKWHIVSVQLPSATVAETSGIGLEKFLLDGVRYIIDRASKIADEEGCGELPLVINFSSGIRGGPHDGTGEIERELDRLIGERRKVAPTQLVLPAGNSFLQQGHAQFELSARGQKGSRGEVNCRVPANDRSHSFIELWLDRPSTAGKNFARLRIETPGGKISVPLRARPKTPDKAAMVLSEDGSSDVLCKVYYQQFADKGRYLIAWVPTDFLNPPQRLAPSGDWKIYLENRSDDKLRADAWIQWDGSPINYPTFGRQAYFWDDAYLAHHPTTGRLLEEDQPASTVKRFGTINAIATGANTLAVGGYNHATYQAVHYSSADFANSCDKPDYMAVSERSDLRAGVLAAGPRSGSVVSLNGTSVAAPQVARRIARLMAGGKTDAQIDAALKKEAKKYEKAIRRHGERYPYPSSAVVPERKGNGRLRFRHCPGFPGLVRPTD